MDLVLKEVPTALCWCWLRVQKGFPGLWWYVGWGGVGWGGLGEMLVRWGWKDPSSQYPLTYSTTSASVSGLGGDSPSQTCRDKEPSLVRSLT